MLHWRPFKCDILVQKKGEDEEFLFWQLINITTEAVLQHSKSIKWNKCEDTGRQNPFY